MKYYIIASMIIISVILFAYCSNSNEDEKEQDLITPVRTASSQLQLIKRPVLTSGLLAPASQMKLSFKTGGIINKLPVDEGMQVTRGQLLAQLDMREIGAKYNQAKSAYEKALRDFHRTRQLYDDSVATIEQYQNAQTALEIAKSNLQVAEFNYKYSSIKAPVDGSILYRLVEVNELVSPGQPVIVFGNTGESWLVRAGVTERELLRLNLGDSGRVRFDAYPDREFPAVVNEIAEAASPVNGTFEVELLLDKSPVSLKSGFVAKIKIFPSEGKQYVTIPVEALVDADEYSAYVFTPAARQDSVKKRKVVIAFIYEDMAVIKDGLEPGTDIITAGVNYITEDSRISIQN